MLRRLKVILILLTVCGNIIAQRADNQVLYDSIAHLSLKQLNRWDLMCAAQKLIAENKKLDPIIAEAVVYTVSERTVTTIVPDIYNEFSDEQLSEVVRFMNTDAYHSVSSYALSEELNLLLIHEMVEYLKLSASWVSNIAPLKNKQYSTLVRKYLLLVYGNSLFEEIVQPLIAQVKEVSGVNDVGQLNEMKKVFKTKLPVYFEAVLFKHISQEQLRKIVDFYSQPYMNQVLKCSSHLTRPVLNGLALNPSAFYQKATKELGNLILIKDTSAIVRSYVHMLPYMAMYSEKVNDTPLLIGNMNHGRSTIRKGVSKTTLQQNGQNVEMNEEGYFIDKELHGNGIMEISRSTYRQREEGYFAFGHLYGLGRKEVTFVTIDGLPCRQIINGYFHEGRLNGEVEYKEQIDFVSSASSDVPIYTFSRFGLDLMCKAPRQSANMESSTLDIHILGLVIDDKLNGRAEVSLSNGDYYRGVFMNGYFLDGTAHVTNKDGSVYEGEFIGGRYEGEGKLTRADGSWEEGIFMFGSFFSGTKRDKRGNIHKIQPQELN